jgi:predicted ArsR family transcriptional regulator
MQTTKQQILVLLKRAGAITIEEAAGALSIASMTARQHLVGLERDGLIMSEKARRSTGRPHFLFSLTSKGEEMFPSRYDLLAQFLIEEIGLLDNNDIDGLKPEEKRSLVLQRTIDRLTEQFRFPVEGRSLEQLVASVTEVLHLIGGFAEWCAIDAGFEIRDYNCVFARLVPQEVSGCQMHVRLITQLLSWPVSHEHVIVDRSECCRYVVSAEISDPRKKELLTNA